MRFFSQVALIVRIEAGFFRKFPKLLYAALVVTVIPAIYTLIYLYSVWDPASHTQSLSVAIVNLDQDMNYKGQAFNVGKEVVSRLKSGKSFGYQEMTDEQSARQAVREGTLAFALIIPSDFSLNALPGEMKGAGTLTVYASEGNSYQIAGLARRFADEMGNAVNDSLNERRWTLLLSASAPHSLQRLREGVSELVSVSRMLEKASVRLDDAAHTLGKGANKLSANLSELGHGVEQLSEGLRKMDAAKPKESDLVRLKTGAVTIESGHLKLSEGLSELKEGSKLLVDGIKGFRSEAEASWLIPGSVVEGLDRLSKGSGKLEEGLDMAVEQHRRLHDGSRQFHSGVNALAEGVQTMNDGLHAMVIRLPRGNAIHALTDGGTKLAAGAEELADGTHKLNMGMQKMSVGIELLADSLPSFMQTFEGSAEGMAHSVQPHVEIDADVPNQGSSFAPNIIPAALWLGAGIIAFLVHVRVLPRQAETLPRSVQLAGKLSIPLSIMLLQAFALLIAVRFVLNIQILHFWAFVMILMTASFTFLSIVFALTRALGDAGKALAMLFLAVQLTSSGGVLPVELSGGVFADISPWMPMTWVVKALKASMFGAYDDAWGIPWLLLFMTGMITLLFAGNWGRWRFVNVEEVRPAVDF